MDRQQFIEQVIQTSNNIRLECLAALAGVSVKTLRNAASNSGANPLRTIKEGSSAVVSPEDALEWLRNRADFRETRIGNVPHLECYENVRQLGLHIATLCRYVNLSIGELINIAKFNENASTATRALPNCPDSENLDALGATEFYVIGKGLGLQNPRQFAKEAIKVVAAHNAVRLAEEQLPN